MTLTIKEQIDGLLAYAEYQEAQAKALCERLRAEGHWVGCPPHPRRVGANGGGRRT